jgi:hypothetical protein
MRKGGFLGCCPFSLRPVPRSLGDRHRPAKEHPITTNRRATLAALAACALVTALAIPAGADQTPRATCVAGGPFISGTAFYEPFTGVMPPARRWTKLEYVIGGSFIGDQNNANIRIYDGDRKVYSYNSPDEREVGVDYTLTLNRWRFVITSPAGRDDYVTFEGVFDFTGWPDSRCTAYSVPV